MKRGMTRRKEESLTVGFTCTLVICVHFRPQGEASVSPQTLRGEQQQGVLLTFSKSNKEGSI
jgi:hypothetical protein